MYSQIQFLQLLQDHLGSLFHLSWVLIVCEFWGINLLLLSCQFFLTFLMDTDSVTISSALFLMLFICIFYLLIFVSLDKNSSVLLIFPKESVLCSLWFFSIFLFYGFLLILLSFPSFCLLGFILFFLFYFFWNKKSKLLIENGFYDICIYKFYFLYGYNCISHILMIYFFSLKFLADFILVQF